ncbi:DNA polymerase III subunit alpha [Entomoplasma ellychniae]|uniref:DNA polymerase III PolC-type n=1 Tax=Entomoplasma ellychniae TaxID=2114 RepID=A0A8E2QWQ0_9MOLU|nr:PolC-type DNA polymerase III [Entomoplasma ellychniae]PPE05077.1 DNA polymerase III subunit alpha [Entomoplasma ellychniae]
MDSKLIDLFTKCNINLEDTEMAYFDKATLQKPVLKTQKNKIHCKISVKNFLPVRILNKVHHNFVNNPSIPLKLILEVKNQRLDKELILEYINFIKENKAQNKTVVWEFVCDRDVKYNKEEKCLYFVVDSNSLKDQLEDELKYCFAKLIQFGFEDLKYYIEIEDNSAQYTQSILEFEQKSKEQYRQISQNKYSTNHSITKQEYKAYAVSLEKPTYDSLADIEDDAQNIVIHAKVNKYEIRDSKAPGRKIYKIAVSDEHSSINAIYFSNGNNLEFFEPLTEEELNSPKIEDIKAKKIKVGDWVALKGKTSYSQWDKEQNFIIEKIGKIEKIDHKIVDDYETKRVELHTHTKMSAMDGVSSIHDYLQLVDNYGWKSLAITDHVNVQVFPDAYNALKKINKTKSEDQKIKLIYGLEMNMIDKNNLWLVKNPKGVKLNETKIVFFDLETTGLSPEMDEIIEFGAIVYDPVNRTEKKHSIFFKPKQPLKNFIKDLTKITDEMLEKEGKDIIEDYGQIHEIIKDSILVAHNANFDLGFLNNASIKAGFGPIQNTIFDTLAIVRLARTDFKYFRLGFICKKFGIMYDDTIAHRADYDAEVLFNLYQKIVFYLKPSLNIIYDHDWNNLIPVNDKENNNLKKSRGMHINILVKNQVGLKELFKLVSISHTENFFSEPKILREKILEIRKNNNILIGAGCVNSEIFDLAKTGTYQQLEEKIKFYDYVEIQPLSVYKHLIVNETLDIEQLKTCILKIIELAKKHNITVVATSDAHYTRPEMKKIRDVYINAKGLGGIRHPLFSFKNKSNNIDHPDQFVRTTKEMLQEFSWLNDEKLINEIVIKNTNAISDQIEPNIDIIRQGLFTPNIEDANQKLKDLCYQTAHDLYGENLPKIVSERLEKELNAIIKHGFAVVYWISHLLVKKSNEDGYLVGSRGSVGSSFVATTSKITEVNPLKAHYRCLQCKYSNFDTPKEIVCGYDLPVANCPNCNIELVGDGHDIPFETFLGFDGDKVPDIDLNFSGEYQPIAHNFTKQMFGDYNVFRAGTISTVAEKTAFGYVKAFYEENDYDESNMPRKVEIERQASQVEGVKRTTGQHPGGIIILPKEYEIEDFTPVNYPADDTTSSWLTTHFDFHSIHDNLLKMDILGHVDPTALKMLYDLTGVDPIKIPTNDKKVYSLFRDLSALGINSNEINGETTGAFGLPEFGTTFVRTMLSETKPSSFADLVQISGLSHGTDVWIGNARELIKNEIADISTVIGCRDDIMVYLMRQGIDATSAFKVMESVRKGNGVPSKFKQMLKDYNIPQWYIESCEKIKYMFPKAHATAYVLMAYRIAWYKVYYPAEYYATFLSTRAEAFDLKVFLGGLESIKEKLNELTSMKKRNMPISAKEQNLIPILEIGLEMYSRNIKIKNIHFEKSEAFKFRIDIDEKTNDKYLVPPFNIIDSLGEAVAMSIVNARKEKPIVSVQDLESRTIVTKTQLKIFGDLKILDSLAEDNQLSFELF